MPISKAALTQGIGSAVNFGFTLFLVRTLTPAEFGIYTAVFALLLFYSGLGTALLVTPLTVHRAGSLHLPAYAARTLLSILIFIAISMLAGSGAGAIAFEYAAVHLFDYFLFALAAFFYLLRDFYMRYAYLIREEGKALAITVVNGLCVVCGCLICANARTAGLSTAAAILLGSQAMSVVAGGFLLNLPIGQQKLRAVMNSFGGTINTSGWSAFSYSVYYAKGQAYLLAVGPLIGVAAVAELGAGRLVIAPLTVLTTALSQVLLPRMASLREKNKQMLWAVSKKLQAALLGGSIIYCIPILLTADHIVQRLLGPAYATVLDTLVLWCIYSLMLALRNGQELTAQALLLFKDVAKINVVAAITCIVASAALTNISGTRGAIAGMIVGEVVVILLIRRCIGRTRISGMS